MRRLYRGQLAPMTHTPTRWYGADLDAAEAAADQGILGPAARLMRAARRDGIFSGVLWTRTAGLVRLPKKFVGDPVIVAEMAVGDTADLDSVPRSLFDVVCPSSELVALDTDGVLLGIGVAELVPVEGRDQPMLVRLDPAYLVYQWSQNQWYYQSTSGLLAITPGDGRWVLHTPGGVNQPWQNGAWRAVGRAYIQKDHAQQYRQNYEGKLANAARVGKHPLGASAEQQEGWFQQLAAWGVNTVFELPEGYEVSLLESNGRGWETFRSTSADMNAEMTTIIAGQTITTEGGAAFQDMSVFKTIRSDLIQSDGDSLARTMNEQVLPTIVLTRWDESKLARGVVMSWETKPASDKNAEANVLVQVGTAIDGVKRALAGSDAQLDVRAVCVDFGVPLMAGEEIDVEVEAARDPAITDTPVQDTALNGAQVAALMQIVQAVVTGLIPRDSAKEMIKLAFLVDGATAERLLGSAGTTFEAAPTPATEAVPNA
jgi:hypothetical protein